MSEIRKPLKRSLLGGIAIFVAALCICLIGAQYFTVRNSLYRQFEGRIGNILNYAQAGIDPDDLAECIRTGMKSERFMETQKHLDMIKEQTGVHYLYVIIPLNTEETDNIRNVMAAVTAYEYENEPDVAIVTLNELTGDAYSADTAKKYLDAYQSEDTSFFENVTVFGSDYTGMRVLKDSEGKKVAALCADYDLAEINQQLRQNLMDSLAVIVILGLLFASAFIVWADTNIVRPVRTLEKGVRDLAEKTHGRRDPDSMVLSLPEIHTGNEVESLARAAEKMSEDIRDHVTNLLLKEKELTRLSAVANRDPLTRVGNRNAYESFQDHLQLKMSEGTEQYAVVVMNTDGLNRINDNYGHEKGDLYLVKACRLLCEVFRHSPVFRMDGDFFSAVLSGEDYQNREELMNRIRRELQNVETDETLSPWERIRASLGMAVYDPQNDTTVKAVMDRAAYNMWEEKKGREQ